jgi:hypothetical protein
MCWNIHFKIIFLALIMQKTLKYIKRSILILLATVVLLAGTGATLAIKTKLYNILLRRPINIFRLG